MGNWYIHKPSGDSYESSVSGILDGSGMPYGMKIFAGLKGAEFADYIFDGEPFHYRYDIKYDTLATESGTIRYVSSIEEKQEPIGRDEGYMEEFYTSSSVGGNFISFPTDNEIRPVNVAVKFMIKAK